MLFDTSSLLASTKIFRLVTRFIQNKYGYLCQRHHLTFKKSLKIQLYLNPVVKISWFCFQMEILKEVDESLVKLGQEVARLRAILATAVAATTAPLSAGAPLTVGVTLIGGTPLPLGTPLTRHPVHFLSTNVILFCFRPRGRRMLKLLGNMVNVLFFLGNMVSVHKSVMMQIL